MGNELIAQAVRAHHAAATALSDDLYANPELPDREFRSSRIMVDMLRSAGYEVEYPYMDHPTAFRAVIDNGEGPAAAILVEYDALPGLGHACGHNVHGSMSILAALALADMRDKLPGKLCIIGTPAEEEAGAKVPMARLGAFDGLALAVMIHSWSGKKSIADMDLLGLQCWLAEFRGQSAHAVAGPWKGRSALAAARKFLDLVDARRECFTPDMHFNGVITEGGQYPNILPEKAVVRLEYRADSRKKMEELHQVMLKCAKGSAMAMDCDVSFTSGFEGFDDMVRVPVLEDEVEKLLLELGEEVEAVKGAAGSSDLGNTSYRCPTVQPLLSICDEPYALHTVELRDSTVEPTAHEAIGRGAELIAKLVYRTLTDADFRESVQRSFEEKLQEKLSD